MRERVALEDMASALPSLDSIKTFWEDEEVSRAFLTALESLKKSPTKKSYNHTLLILAGHLLFWCVIKYVLCIFS